MVGAAGRMESGVLAGDECAGTADERAGTADERAGTADERAGTADERAGAVDERAFAPAPESPASGGKKRGTRSTTSVT